MKKYWENNADRCKCDICEYSREAEKMISELPEMKHQEFFHDMFDRMSNAQFDLDYSNAIIDGFWHNADAIIAHRRAKRVTDAAPSTVIPLVQATDVKSFSVEDTPQEVINAMQAELARPSPDAPPQTVNVGLDDLTAVIRDFYKEENWRDNDVNEAYERVVRRLQSALEPSPDAAPQETDPLMMPRELMEQVLIDLTRLTNFVSDEDAVRSVIRHVEYFMSPDAPPCEPEGEG